MRCNAYGDVTPDIALFVVSIPVGFSSALQRCKLQPVDHCAVCFNPCRVFKCAATADVQLAPFRQVGFNPCRVFKCAATHSSRRSVRVQLDVSIPVGFSSALQLYPRRRADGTTMCFNPCRVFKCAATSSNLHHHSKACVSIPVGFSSALQPGWLLKRMHVHRSVSIPVGFSSALQPILASALNVSEYVCFNPCRVFKCAATSVPIAAYYGPNQCFNPCRVFKCAATR